MSVKVVDVLVAVVAVAADVCRVADKHASDNIKN
jgi:hypothetical protein